MNCPAKHGWNLFPESLPADAPPAPPVGRRPVWVFSLVVLAAFYLLYAFTAQRGVSWQDSGEFQYRVLVGDYHWHSGIARAHPLYILLARGFAAGFAPAARLHAINLLSGLGMSVALAFLAALIAELTRSRWRALLAVALLGCAHMGWWMATIAEVYTWSVAGLMAEVFLVWRYVTTRQGRWLILLFAVNGLHAAIHNTALLNLPVHLALLVGHWRSAGRGRKAALRAAAIEPSGPAAGVAANRWALPAGVMLVWLAGASMLVGLVIQEAWRTGRVLGALQSLLFGTGYQEQVLGLQSPEWRQVGANLALAGLSLLNPGWLLAGIGLFRARIGALRKPLLALTLLHGLFWIRYFVPDQATFVLPSLGLLAIWAGAGCGSRATAGVAASGARGRALMRLLPQEWRGGLVYILLGLLCAAGLPWLLSHTAAATGLEVRRSRQLPFRDEARYWLVPWKQNEDSAARFVAAVDAQLGSDDWLVADATAAGPLLAARAAGGLSDHWRLVTPWSAPAEQTGALAALARGARVFVVSPGKGYAPTWLLTPGLRAVREGVLWRVVGGE